MAALVKEDGSGVAGANSYADVADGDAYHAKRLNAEKWTAADADKKSVALQMATQLIDAHCVFTGQRANADQPLEWPKYAAENESGEDIVGYYTVGVIFGLAPGPWYPPDYIPPRLVQATCELARELLTKDRVAALEPEQTGVKSLNLGQGAFAVTFDASDAPSLFTPTVEALLAPIARLPGRGLMVPVSRVG